MSKRVNRRLKPTKSGLSSAEKKSARLKSKSLDQSASAKARELNARAGASFINADAILESANASREELRIQAAQELADRQASHVNEMKLSRHRVDAMEGNYTSAGLLLEGSPMAILRAQRKTDEINIMRRSGAVTSRGRNLINRGQEGLAAAGEEAAAMRRQGAAYASQASQVKSSRNQEKSLVRKEARRVRRANIDRYKTE